MGHAVGGHDCKKMMFHCALCKESVLGFLHLTVLILLFPFYLLLVSSTSLIRLATIRFFLVSRSLTPDLMCLAKTFESNFSRLACSPAAILSSGDGLFSWLSLSSELCGSTSCTLTSKLDLLHVLLMLLLLGKQRFVIKGDAMIANENQRLSWNSLCLCR